MKLIKNAESWQFTRILIALVLCQLGLHATMHGMRVAVPLQALSQGYSPMVVGILVSMFAVVPALLAIAFGRYADRVGYHLPVKIAASLSLIAGASLALSDSFFALCIGAACSGAGSGFGMIAIQRTASKMATSSASRLKIFSWVALAPSSAGLLGPLLAGVMIDHYGYREAFAILGCLPIMTLLLSYLVPREKIEQQDASANAPPKRIMDLLGLLQVRRLLFINWAVVASWDVHGFVVPILGHEQGFSATAIGGIFAAFGMASIVVRVIIPLFLSSISPRNLMVGAVMLAAASLLIYPFLHVAWAMSVCAFAFGIALGSAQPSILATLHEVTPGERHGEALAMRSTFTQGSMLVMPLMYGAVGASLGAGMLLWVMSAALGVGAWQVNRLFKGIDSTNKA